MPGLEQQPCVDELARPEPMRRIGKIGLELDRAGGLQDLIVDEGELAFVELDLVVVAIGEDRQRPLGHLLLNLRQVGLRQREDHRDRLDLGDHDEAVGVGRVDDVADIDLPYAGDPVDRRGQPGVVELHLGRFDQRLVGFDGALQLDTCAFWVSSSCGVASALGQQLVVAVEIGVRVCELGLIAIARGDHLVELGLIGTRIDLASRSPAFTVCPSVKAILVICPWIWLRTTTVL